MTVLPAFPGAPALLNSALGAIGGLPALQIADAIGLQTLVTQAQWGIYNSSGQLVISSDSTVKFSYIGDSTISDYPVEGGGFQSYNKVANPFTIKMTVALSGTFSVQTLVAAAGALASGGLTVSSITGAYANLTGSAARTAFLNSITAYQDSTALLTVVTPELHYPNVNIVHQEYDRSADQGATLLSVDIWLEEVRVTASNTVSNTQGISGQDPVSTGPVQTTSPTVSQNSIITATGSR